MTLPTTLLCECHQQSPCCVKCPCQVPCCVSALAAPRPPTLQVYEEAQAERAHQNMDWPLLTPTQRAAAEQLAGQVAEGRLALFLGAGVSSACGLATWEGLLDTLAEQV
jgi:hypothetical protein